MNENKKKMYDLSGPKTVEAMKKRHFTPITVPPLPRPWRRRWS